MLHKKETDKETCKKNEFLYKNDVKYLKFKHMNEKAAAGTSPFREQAALR